jgi:hypothetical protein
MYLRADFHVLAFIHHSMASENEFLLELHLKSATARRIKFFVKETSFPDARSLKIHPFKLLFSLLNKYGPGWTLYIILPCMSMSELDLYMTVVERGGSTSFHVGGWEKGN